MTHPIRRHPHPAQILASPHPHGACDGAQHYRLLSDVEWVEPEPGHFDFASGSRDYARFIELCAEEGMWAYVRPGPYVCAEWDFGGLPAWLLRDGYAMATTSRTWMRWRVISMPSRRDWHR